MVFEDTLKAAAPFETRAFLLSAICGFPRQGAYRSEDGKKPDPTYPVLTEVLGFAMDRAGKDSALTVMLARTFGLQETANANG